MNIHNPCPLIPVSLLIQICPWKYQRLARLKTLAVPPDKTQGQCAVLSAYLTRPGIIIIINPSVLLDNTNTCSISNLHWKRLSGTFFSSFRAMKGKVKVYDRSFSCFNKEIEDLIYSEKKKSA